MEVCYDGALVMPSSYAVMDAEEMTYVEGGGTFRLIASKSTVKKICRGATGLVCGIIGQYFGSVLGTALSAAIGMLVFNFIIDVCGVQFKAIDKSWTHDWLPTWTFNLNKYV